MHPVRPRALDCSALVLVALLLKQTLLRAALPPHSLDHHDQHCTACILLSVQC